MQTCCTYVLGVIIGLILSGRMHSDMPIHEASGWFLRVDEPWSLAGHETVYKDIMPLLAIDIITMRLARVDPGIYQDPLGRHPLCRLPFSIPGL